MRPTGVMRGSFFSFRQIPSRSLSARISARRASASWYIERNLIMPKVAPPKPTRFCTKKTDPRELRPTASATPSKTGQSTARISSVSTMSKRRLASITGRNGAERAVSKEMARYLSTGK